MSDSHEIEMGNFLSYSPDLQPQSFIDAGIKRLMLTRKLINTANGILVAPGNITNSNSYAMRGLPVFLPKYEFSGVIEGLSNNWLKL